MQIELFGCNIDGLKEQDNRVFLLLKNSLRPVKASPTADQDRDLDSISSRNWSTGLFCRLVIADDDREPVEDPFVFACVTLSSERISLIAFRLPLVTDVTPSTICSSFSEWLCIHADSYLPNVAIIYDGFTNSKVFATRSKTELGTLYWITYFGTQLVDHYGRDFLLNAPAFKVQEMTNGILMMGTRSYAEWNTRPPKHLLEYFRAKSRNIKFHKADFSDGWEKDLLNN